MSDGSNGADCVDAGKRVSEIVGVGGELPAAETDELVTLLYGELRQLAGRIVARRRPGATITGTVLVNEAYVKLVRGLRDGWEGRAHFFGAASRAMEQVLADYWAGHRAAKRGGGKRPIPLDTPLLTSNELLRPDGSSGPAIDTFEHFEDLRRAIDELAAEMPRAADVVRLRFLVGFSVQETADLLGVSLRTAESDWTFAKAFLAARLGSV